MIDREALHGPHRYVSPAFLEALDVLRVAGTILTAVNVPSTGIREVAAIWRLKAARVRRGAAVCKGQHGCGGKGGALHRFRLTQPPVSHMSFGENRDQVDSRQPRTNHMVDLE